MVILRKSLVRIPDSSGHARKGLGNNLALSTGMLPLPSVLMKERTPHQPTSVRVLLNTGSEYTVEILKIGVHVEDL